MPDNMASAFIIPSDNTSAIDDKTKLNIHQSVKSILADEGYITSSVVCQVLPSDGGSYFGILCQVDIKGQTIDGYKETNVFMKLIIPSAQITILSVKDAYKKELFFYKDLCQLFNEVQDEAGLIGEERFDYVKSYAESTPEVIILDNMRNKGFKTNNRKDLVSLEFMELAVKELAKFHGMSFVLEARRPDYYNRKIKTIPPPYKFSDEYDTFLKNTYQITTDNLEGEERKRFEDYIPKLLSNYRKYVNENSETKCCLCHGDYRVNNVLMMETDNKITKVIIIDYQLLHYGCPVLDFLYFIIPATDREFRKSHLSYLKDVYYQTLECFLEKFNLDANTVYHRMEFERVYQERLDYGLIMGLCLLPFLLAKEEDLPAFSGEKSTKPRTSTDDIIKDRVVGIVRDYIEWGIL